MAIRPIDPTDLDPADLDQRLTALEPERWPTLVPGDPDRIATLASRLQGTGATLRQQSQRLVAVDPNTYWQGAAAVAFARRKTLLPPLLDAAETRYDSTGGALGSYGRGLGDCQQDAQAAARAGAEARTAVEAAGYPLADWPRWYRPAGEPEPPSPPPITPEPPITPMPPPIVDPIRPGPRPGPVSPLVTDPTDRLRAGPVTTSGPATTATPPLTMPPVTMPPPAIVAEYERFGAAVKRMEAAIADHRVLARRCAQAIGRASDDRLRDSPAYSSDLSRLKRALLANLGDIAPATRTQIARLTGVTGLLGWIPVVGMTSSRDRHALAEKLSHDAAAWRDGTTDGRTVVDDFLAVLSPDGSPNRHVVPVP